jgi:purine nucleoside phosphorylase
LSAVADRVADAVRIGYADIPGFFAPTVEGHRGELVAGTSAGARADRAERPLHMYEGTPRMMPLCRFASSAHWARYLLVTNAAGGIRQTFAPGTVS